MSWVVPRVWAVSEDVTAAKMNEISAALNDLDRRTSPSGAVVVTNESTVSGTYTDLATAGPAVTVTIGSTGKALLSVFSAIQGSVAGNEVFIGFVLSGANTVAAADGTATSFTPGSAGGAAHVGAPFLLTGLTAGVTTFTAKYKRNTSGTANYSDRRLAVTPLGS